MSFFSRKLDKLHAVFDKTAGETSFCCFRKKTLRVRSKSWFQDLFIEYKIPQMFLRTREKPYLQLCRHLVAKI